MSTAPVPTPAETPQAVPAPAPARREVAIAWPWYGWLFAGAVVGWVVGRLGQTAALRAAEAEDAAAGEEPAKEEW